MLTTFLSENLEGREHLGDLRVDGRIILNGFMLTGCTWFRIESNSGQL
jgi:hypothetical protein